MKIRPRKGRPLIVVVSQTEMKDPLCCNKSLQKFFLSHKDIIDFGYRDSVKEICLEEENLFLIIFFSYDSSAEIQEFVTENAGHDRISLIHNTKQLEGNNASLGAELIKTKFRQLQRKFPQLKRR